MKSLQRKIAGVMLAIAAVPFLVAGGLSRMEQIGVPPHPNRWMLVPGLLLLVAARFVYGPRRSWWR
jgi:uncharacterized membrane protein